MNEKNSIIERLDNLLTGYCNMENYIRDTLSGWGLTKREIERSRAMKEVSKRICKINDNLQKAKNYSDDKFRKYFSIKQIDSLEKKFTSFFDKIDQELESLASALS